MRQSHLILSNALIIWTSRVLLLVPQVVLVPYLIGTIGEAGYGVYALIWSLLMGIDRFEKSLQSGVVKYSAAFFAEGRTDDVNRVVSSSFLYSLALGCVASVAIFAAAFWADTSADLGFSLLVVGALVLFVVPLTPFIAVTQARQRYYVGMIAETASKYISLGVIFAWFNFAAPSVQALIIIMMVMLFLSRLAQVPVAYRLVPGLKNRPALFDRGMFRLILAFGGMTTFIALFAIANTTGVRWLMGLLVSTSFVAHLAIMLMPGILLSQIVLAMTITIMPATSAYEAAGNQRMLRELLLRSMRYTSIIVLAALLVGVLLIEDVLALWVGAEYRFLAPFTLAIFASVALLMTTSSAHHMLKGLGKLRISVFNSFVGQVAVPFSLILLLFFTSYNGYIAITVGLVAGNTAWALLQVGFAMKAVGAGFREILSRVYAQPMLAAAAVALPALALVGYVGVEGLIPRSALAAVVVAAFLGLMYFGFATPAERRQAADIVRAVRRRAGATMRTAAQLKSARM